MIIGVWLSATGSSAASAAGVMFGPTITSTWSSVISLRMLRTAAPGSERVVENQVLVGFLAGDAWPATSAWRSCW